MKAQIAQHLSISENQIKSVEEWAHVLFVRFNAGRPRFVSKSAVATSVATIEPLAWTLEAQTRRQEGKKWVARITGTSEKYTFARQFIKPTSSEWGKYGVCKAVFEIDSPGYYQDSDGDYFRVFTAATGFDAEICSYQEVKHNFYVQLVTH